MSSIHTILVPVDFSDASAQALEYATDIAKTCGATLHLLHAYESPLLELKPYDFAFPLPLLDEIRDAASERLDKWRDRVPPDVPVKARLSPRPATLAIEQVEEEIGADLVVMGTRGHTGLKHVLLGSVAERTVRTAHCPVLTLKS